MCWWSTSVFCFILGFYVTPADLENIVTRAWLTGGDIPAVCFTRTLRGQGKNTKWYLPVCLTSPSQGHFLTPQKCQTSTLATDRGFKERVREDMLVRLLDAFVWRNYGRPPVTTLLSNVSFHFSCHIFRSAGNTATRVHLRSRDECSCCSLPVHYAFGVGSIFLLREIHWRVLPTLCPANIRRCSPWLEGNISLFLM